MKKVIMYTLFGILCSPMLSFSENIKKELFAPNHGMMSIVAFWFEIPADNASSSFVKVIENPTPNTPKAMKSSIYFGEEKITFINKNGVVRDYMNKAELIDAVKSDKEQPRVWKIPNPKESPKNDNDFIATFQIYQNGVVVTFKDDNKPIVYSLKK
jgi:hypothetical protein